MAEKKKESLVIIDADSIMYILGPSLKNMPLEPLGLIKLDEFLKDILISTNSKEYLGFFGTTKGRNFRKDVATTVKYKGSRPEEKPDWFQYWAPIFKRHMETVWKFQGCDNIEADDAVAIAVEANRDKYEKIFVASPDKDLFQIPNIWFYNYDKRYTVWVDEETALTKYLIQLIMGDSSDSIPGLFGAGETVAKKEVDRINKIDQITKEKSIQEIEEYYVKWHVEIQLEKQTKKQQKDYLAKYKKDNDVKRLTAKIKDLALQEFVVDTSMLLTEEQARALFVEQKSLLTMLNTEEQGKKYEFILGEPNVDTRVDWDSIVSYQDELNEIPDEEDFDFIEDEL